MCDFINTSYRILIDYSAGPINGPAQHWNMFIYSYITSLLPYRFFCYSLWLVLLTHWWWMFELWALYTYARSWCCTGVYMTTLYQIRPHTRWYPCYQNLIPVYFEPCTHLCQELALPVYVNLVPDSGAIPGATSLTSKSVHTQSLKITPAYFEPCTHLCQGLVLPVYVDPVPDWAPYLVPYPWYQTSPACRSL